jgi:hypothetical protein
VKSDEEITEILEAVDLTRSFRAAGELAGCSHHIVEHYVGLHDGGRLAVGVAHQRVELIDAHVGKVEEWVERSDGKIRADVVAGELELLACAGSERPVRRVAAAVKVNFRAGRRRVYRPWVAEPGMSAQSD